MYRYQELGFPEFEALKINPDLPAIKKAALYITEHPEEFVSGDDKDYAFYCTHYAHCYSLL